MPSVGERRNSAARCSLTRRANWAGEPLPARANSRKTVRALTLATAAMSSMSSGWCQLPSMNASILATTDQALAGRLIAFREAQTGAVAERPQ